jgi:opacity protein-like surface antigen
MKKTKYMTALLCLISNVALAGSASIGYTSDYFRRGALLSEEAVQSSVSYSKDLLGLEFSVGASTNQPVSVGEDSYIIEGGASKQFGELLDLYVGLQHFEQRSSASSLEVQVGATFNTLLNPSASLFRDTDDELYTFELGLGHSFDLNFAELDLSASYGNTDVTESQNEDYYTLGAVASKSLSDNATAELGYEYVDSDLISAESIVSASVVFSF